MRVQKASSRVLDKIDHHILSILQQDGRIAMKDLAEQVGLSLTPCIERVKRMERDGVIAGYYARVNPQALGLQILCSSRSRCTRNPRRPSTASSAPCSRFPR
jgi:Lrp/AsnC family leucine-responsive transcriptional regulator